MYEYGGAALCSMTKEKYNKILGTLFKKKISVRA